MSEQQRAAVGLAEVNALRRAGLIGAEQYLDAAYACREPGYWSRWASRALLALGAGHLLAGIIFFFAFNWENLPLFGKFAVLEGAIVICAVAALIVRLDRAAGQALLIGASVMTGTLLAVIGQVYQTGADAYELFATWALVIVPWVVASRSAAHWFVWLVVGYLAVNLYGYQVLVPNGILTLVQLSCLLALATVVILAAREAGVVAGAGWLGPRWTRIVPAFAALAMVFTDAIAYVFGIESALIGAITFVAIVIAMAAVYLRLLPDFAVVATTTGFVALFLMAVGGRAIQETSGFDADDTFRLLSSLTLLTLWCASVTTGTVRLLTGLRRQMQQGDARA